jgi:hypothetical protein
MTQIEKYVTINSYLEKVECRTYPSGRTRWYIKQGKWYPIEAELVERYINEGIVLKDLGMEDYISKVYKMMLR